MGLRRIFQVALAGIPSLLDESHIREAAGRRMRFGHVANKEVTVRNPRAASR